MKKRHVRFTPIDGDSVLLELELPGSILHPPKYILFRGNLYHNTGTGLGVRTVNHYRQVSDRFMIVEEDIPAIKNNPL